MIFVAFIFIYCTLEIIRRILKPRTIPRLCDYNFESGTAFIFIIGIYVAFKTLVQGMTLTELRKLSDV